jgi:hypothetical protein
MIENAMPNVGAIAENIALLSMVDTQLELPTSSSLPNETLSNRELSYSLDPKHEQQIAQTFAILLAYDDRPEKVGAVCVEELSNGSGLVIRTAVNSGSQTERMQTFRKLANAISVISASGMMNSHPQQDLTDSAWRC